VATSNNPTVTSKVALGEVVVLRLDGLDSLVAKLAQLGFDTKGPVVNPDTARTKATFAQRHGQSRSWGLAQTLTTQE
jgi:hypothetical protein